MISSLSGVFNSSLIFVIKYDLYMFEVVSARAGRKRPSHSSSTVLPQSTSESVDNTGQCTSEASTILSPVSSRSQASRKIRLIMIM